MSLARRRTPAESDQTNHHWYYDADPEDRREYDAFGPWIGEVATEADLPRRFRFAWPRLSGARFILKLPIGAERAAVRPGWDLYKLVIALDDSGVTILRQIEETVTEEHLAWSDIAAVRSYANLLIGRWTLITRAGAAVTIDYNTVSARTLDAATAFARGRMAWDDRVNAPPQAPALPVTDHIFRYTLFSLGQTGPQPAVPIHVEPSRRWCRDAAGRRRLTTGVMLVATPTELVLVDRDTPTRGLLAPHYAIATTAIPWRRLTAFAFDEAVPSRPRRFHTLVLRLDASTIRQPCLDVPVAVLAALRGHGVPEVAA